MNKELDRPRIAHLMKIGMTAALIVLMGDMLLGWGMRIPLSGLCAPVLHPPGHRLPHDDEADPGGSRGHETRLRRRRRGSEGAGARVDSGSRRGRCVLQRAERRGEPLHRRGVQRLGHAQRQGRAGLRQFPQRHERHSLLRLGGDPEPTGRLEGLQGRRRQLVQVL